jgi:hypothetical protein
MMIFISTSYAMCFICLISTISLSVICLINQLRAPVLQLLFAQRKSNTGSYCNKPNCTLYLIFIVLNYHVVSLVLKSIKRFLRFVLQFLRLIMLLFFTLFIISASDLQHFFFSLNVHHVSAASSSFISIFSLFKLV